MSNEEKKQRTEARVTERAFAALPFAEKRAYLARVGAKERMDLLISDPDGKRLATAMSPQEFFWLFKEVGEADAVDLIPLASAEQCVFMLDMELWEGWHFSEEKAGNWLAYFMEGGTPRIHELLKRLDFEFLLLFLGRELIVAGGIGDVTDEERFADYDHTFDDVFMLTFRNPKHSRLVGSFLAMMLELDKPLYTALMEGIKGGADVELEELCHRFRTGRLQDLGFPPLEEAISIYARVNPATFEPSRDKVLYPAEEYGTLVPHLGSQQNSFLARALARVDSPVIVQELNYLVNSALVAEGVPFSEVDLAGSVLQRVDGYLTIALEHLCAADEARAAEYLVGESLKRLFQLGYSIVLELRFAAEKIETTDYASGKALAGLKQKRPRFYRGLDPDGVDGYREFRELADVKRTARLLADLKG